MINIEQSCLQDKGVNNCLEVASAGLLPIIGIPEQTVSDMYNYYVSEESIEGDEPMSELAFRAAIKAKMDELDLKIRECPTEYAEAEQHLDYWQTCEAYSLSIKLIRNPNGKTAIFMVTDRLEAIHESAYDIYQEKCKDYNEYPLSRESFLAFLSEESPDPIIFHRFRVGTNFSKSGGYLHVQEIAHPGFLSATYESRMEWYPKS